MENRNDNQFLNSRSIEDAIRETPNECSVQASVHLCIQPRMLLDRSKRVVERSAKLQAQARCWSYHSAASAISFSASGRRISR